MIEWGPDNGIERGPNKEIDQSGESFKRFTEGLNELEEYISALSDINNLPPKQIPLNLAFFIISSANVVHYLQKAFLEQVGYILKAVEELIESRSNKTSQHNQSINTFDQAAAVLELMAELFSEVSESIHKLSSYFAVKSKRVKDDNFKAYAGEMEFVNETYKVVSVRFLEDVKIIVSNLAYLVKHPDLLKIGVADLIINLEKIILHNFTSFEFNPANQHDNEIKDKLEELREQLQRLEELL